jgi:hypothetical protein
MSESELDGLATADPDNLADSSHSKKQAQPRVSWELGKEPSIDLINWHIHDKIPWQSLSDCLLHPESKERQNQLSSNER